MVAQAASFVVMSRGVVLICLGWGFFFFLIFDLHVQQVQRWELQERLAILLVSLTFSLLGQPLNPLIGKESRAESGELRDCCGNLGGG